MACCADCWYMQLSDKDSSGDCWCEERRRYYPPTDSTCPDFKDKSDPNAW